MRKNNLIFALAVLLITSLACSGRQSAPAITPTTIIDTEMPIPPDQGTGDDIQTEFPLPDDAKGVIDIGEGAINFQTAMSAEDTIAFYRDTFSRAGYAERIINTSITETTFSLVFDGHASGKAVVVQGFDLGDGTTNVSIRLEEV